MTAEVKKLIRIFGIHQFFHWGSIGIIIPVLTLILMQKGLDLFQVGIFIAINTATIFLLELPTGGLADQIGRVKVYLISTVFSVLAMVLLLVDDHMIFVYIAAVMLGVARSLSTGTLDAWFIEQFQHLSPKGRLQVALAKIEVWITLGIGCGALLGGVLPMIGTWFGLDLYTLNIALIALINLSVAIYTIIRIRESRAYQSQGFLRGFSTLPVVLKDAIHFGFGHSGVLLLITATAFWGFSIVGLENYWQPQVKSILGSAKQSWIFGLLSGGYFFAAAFGSIIITPISCFFKHRYAMILMLFRAIMGISFIILAYQTTIWGFGLVYFVLFMQNGMLNSPHQSLFHKIVPDDKRSTLISLESFMMSIGAMAGSLILGWIANYHTISTSWIVAGVVFTGSGLCYLAFELYRHPKLEAKKDGVLTTT